MGYCNKCGAQIPDASSFCPKCGNAVVSTQDATTQNANVNYNWHQGTQPRSNNTLVYVLIGIIALMLVGGLVYFLMSKSDEKHNQEMAELSRKNELLEKQNQLLEEDAKSAEESAKVAEESAKAAQKDAENAKRQKVIVKEGAVHAAEHLAASSGHTPKVVIDGKGVRLRFGPSLSAGYLTDSKGRNKSVPKGKKLKWTGWEDGDWYEVEYLGNYFYVSKQFSYLEY